MLLERTRRDRVNIVEIDKSEELVFLLVLVQPELGGAQNEPALFPSLSICGMT